MDFKEFVETHTIGEIKKAYPPVVDYLDNTGLWNLPENLTFAKAFEDIDEEDLWQVGIKGDNIADELAKFIAAMRDVDMHTENNIESITIIGGMNKQGEAENVKLSIYTGEIVSIVGPTGSGKSRLLADIECLAQGDTPTRRQILINGKALDDEARFDFDGKLVAQLSQNMNFIMDVSVEDFLIMHAKVRLGRECDLAQTVNRCYAMANELAGEKFTLDTKVTQLSGGQGRPIVQDALADLRVQPLGDLHPQLRLLGVLKLFDAAGQIGDLVLQV